MEFFHGIVALLAFLVLVLAGMVAWLYMQQTRLLQAVNALAIAVSTPPPSMLAPEPMPAPEVPMEVTEDVVVQEEDDRVSVYDADDESVESAEEEGGPAPAIEEIVDYNKKTIAELRDLLTQKGIPFNKSDKKPTLVSLIQATA
jgi:hypothetical protein